MAAELWAVSKLASFDGSIGTQYGFTDGGAWQSPHTGTPPSMPQARYPIGAVELKLKAGDAVIFQHGVFHAGASNLSDQTRIALYYGYSYRVMRPIDYDKMPVEFLQKCTPIGRQL